MFWKHLTVDGRVEEDNEPIGGRPREMKIHKKMYNGLSTIYSIEDIYFTNEYALKY